MIRWSITLLAALLHYAITIAIIKLLPLLLPILSLLVTWITLLFLDLFTQYGLANVSGGGRADVDVDVVLVVVGDAVVVVAG